MRKILAVLALVTCVGCTKYKPYLNSPQEHLLMGDHLPLNVQEKLRPIYRSCTPEELVDVKTDQQIEQRHYKCSVVIVQHDDRIHLVNWEAPADIAGQPQGALAAGFAALRAAQKYKIVTGSLYNTGNWSDSFRFCEIHATDSDAMHWEEGKCWSTQTENTNTAPVVPPTSTPALKTTGAQGVHGLAIQPTPRSPVQLNPETVEHIRASVATPWTVLPELKGVLRHVFGDDVAKFEFSTDGPGELKLSGDDAFFHFCKSHACPDHEGALAINLSTGRAAGALVENGTLYTYQGDYATQNTLPESLQNWIKESTEP